MIHLNALVMEKALKTVLDGKMNCMQAAKMFNLSKTTLYDRIKKTREQKKVKKEQGEQP